MNEQIEQLETQLSEMNRTKRIGIYAVILISAIYMSWVLFGEALNDEILSSEEQIVSLESKLQRNSSRSLEAAIVKTKKDILELQDAINHLYFKQQFVETKLQGIDFIFYDEKGSAQVLDDILKRSVDSSITIDKIQKIAVNDHNATMLKVKSRLQISGTGTFDAITSLMYYVESLNALLVSDALHVSIDDDNATYFELGLLHYGVEL